MKKRIKFLSVIAALAIVGCNQSSEQSSLKDFADAIYYDGDIITMEGDNAEYAEAVAIKDIIVLETLKEGNTIYKR